MISKNVRQLVWLIGSLMFLLLFDTFFFSRAQAQGQCEKKLAEAEAKYEIGLLDEAIEMALHCLENSALTDAERQRSYWLLGKVYYAKQLLDNSKEYLRKLLEMIPNWRPDPENDSPAFQALAEEVIKEVEAEKQKQQEQTARAEQEMKTPVDTSTPARTFKKSGGKKWLWIGGGALAAGTAAFLISRGDEKPLRLPDPPALPIK